MAVAISRTADPASVSASSNVATYSGVSIGAAANDRIVCVVVTTELASSTPSACTIGGVAANASTTGNFGAVYARIFWLPVASGTTADIAVTYSATNPTNVQNHISVYRVTGAVVWSTGGTGSTDMDATSPLTTGAITIPTNGGFLAVAGGATASTAAKTWANATEDLEVSVTNYCHTAATRTTSLTATAVTCTGGTNGEDGAMSWMIFHDGTVVNKSESVTVTESRTVVANPPLEINESESVTVNDGYIVCDSYSVTRDGDYGLSTNRSDIGQSFTGDGGTLDSAVFQLNKLNSPTGNIYAVIYAHSGTYGTSSVGTGAALATSDPLDASTLTTSYASYTFTFTGANRIALTNGTNYVVAINGVGNTTNRVQVGCRVTSPAHSGNASTKDSGSWVADNTTDLIFAVNSGRAVQVQVETPTSDKSINKSDTATLSESVSLKRSTNALIDNFDDNTLDTAHWNEYETGTATAAETSGTLVVTPPNATAGSNYAGYYTDVAYNLTDSSVYVEVPTVTSGSTNAQTYFELEIDSSNLLGITKEGTSLKFRYVSSGTPSETSTTYNATDHRWWRISHSGSNVLWDTSPDGLTWTNQRTVATPITITSLFMEIGAGTYQSETSPGTAVFDNFNFVLNRSVSVSDTSTLTESVQRQVENRVSVSDTTTLTESVSVLVENYALSVSDTATLTESVQREVTNFIVETENITVTDTPQVTILERFVSVSDTATVSESVSVTIQTDVFDVNVSVSDSVTVSENLLRQVENRVQVSDTSTLTENVSIYQENYVINKTDTATVTENVQRLVENRIFVFDTTVVTDSPTVTITAIDDLLVNVSDTATLTENRTVLIPELLVNKSDNVTVTESTSLLIPELNINKSENVTVTESVNLFITELFIQETENVSTTENVIVNAGNQAFYNVITSENVTVSEQVTVEASNVLLTASETATVSESVSVSIQPTLTPTISVSDTTTVTENAIIEPALVAITVSDTTTLTDAPTVSVPTITWSINVSDSISGTATQQRNYYIDSNGDIYWVINQALGLVEKI